MDSVNVTGMLYVVPIEGNTRPTIEPAFTAEDARITVEHRLNQQGLPQHALQARPATDRDVRDFINWYDSKIGNGVNPPAHTQHVRQIIAAQFDHPTPAPPSRPILTTPAPQNTSALAATAWTLTQMGLSITVLTALTGTLWALAYVLPLIPYILTATICALTVAIFGAQWLNRLHPTTLQPTRPHIEDRDYSDEYARRQILANHLQHVGPYCPGTEWCQPERHPSDDLTVDHTHARSKGGTLADGYTVMCREANSRKGTR